MWWVMILMSVVEKEELYASELIWRPFWPLDMPSNILYIAEDRLKVRISLFLLLIPDTTGMPKYCYATSPLSGASDS